MKSALRGLLGGSEAPKDGTAALLGPLGAGLCPAGACGRGEAVPRAGEEGGEAAGGGGEEDVEGQGLAGMAEGSGGGIEGGAGQEDAPWPVKRDSLNLI